MTDDTTRGSLEHVIRQGESAIEAHFLAPDTRVVNLDGDTSGTHEEELIDHFLYHCNEIGRILKELSLWLQSVEHANPVKLARKPGRLHQHYPGERTPP